MPRIGAEGLALCAAAVLLVHAAPAAAETLRVDTTADELTAHDGHCSLREAVAAVNAAGSTSDCGTATKGGANTIVLGPGHYALVFPPTGADGDENGDLNVGAASVTITGAGQSASVIDASGIGGLHDRVLSVSNTATVLLAHLAVTGGHATDGEPGSNGSGGNGSGGEDGGAIFNDGALTLEDVSVTASSAGDGGKGGSGKLNKGATGGPGGNGGPGGAGGGIFNNFGALTLIDTTVSGNHAGTGGKGGEGGEGNTGGVGGAGGVGPADGGGVSSEGGKLTILGSTISANVAGGGGVGGSGGHGLGQGGNGGKGGSASWGGGISALESQLTITNSTITANAPGEGGAGGPGGEGGSEELVGEPPEEICNPGDGGNGGDGGGGGNGGGLRSTSSSSTLLNVTIADDEFGFGGAGGQAGPGICFGNPGNFGNFANRGSATEAYVQGTTLLWKDSIISGTHGENCVGPMSSAGTTDLSFGPFDTSCPASIHSDPLLGPLQENGGPTDTMALPPGSPALDLVPGSGAGCPETDQRGVRRPQGSGCDLGAYELAPPAAVTEGASEVSTTTAAIAGSATANAADASVHFDFGTTAAYGSETAVQHVGGVAPTNVVAALGGLTPATTYHYRIVATTPDGTATGSDQTFTTGAVPASGEGPPSGGLQGAAQQSGAQQGGVQQGGVQQATVAVANLSSVSETSSVFAVGPTSTALVGQAARHHPRGTTFGFVLDRPATVSIAIQRTAAGRLVGHRCGPDITQLRRRPRCTRTIALVTLTRSAHSGTNRVPFSGRIAGRALAPGRYRAVFAASDAAGRSASRTLSFTVVGR